MLAAEDIAEQIVEASRHLELHLRRAVCAPERGVDTGRGGSICEYVLYSTPGCAYLISAPVVVVVVVVVAPDEEHDAAARDEE